MFYRVTPLNVVDLLRLPLFFFNERFDQSYPPEVVGTSSKLFMAYFVWFTPDMQLSLTSEISILFPLQRIYDMD